MSRYLVCHGWGHIFSEEDGERERTTRFVYDTLEQSLPVLDIQRGNKWRAASRAEKDDLLDSLINANPDALENPESWDLMPSDEIPDWD